MVKYTVLIYRFFQKHKFVFYSILIATTLFLGFFASKIQFEEDISKLLPSAEEGGAEDLVFSNLKVKDKIFILFSPRSEDVSPEDLIEVSDAFVAELIEKDTLYQAIDNVLYRIDENLLPEAIAYLYENVPVYLDSADYEALDELLEADHIKAQMAENYAMLRSPAGAAFKDMIVTDPVALRNVFLSGVGDMANGLGGNYRVYESHFFTPDTTVAIAFLSPNFKSFDSGQGTILSEMIEGLIGDFVEQYPDVEVLYHGAPVQSVYNSRRIKLDLLLTISISLILIITILLICFKNKSTILYLICPVIYGVLFALAIVYFIKGSISLMAMGIGAIVMGVAFSYCLHIITHYKYVNDPEKVLRDETNAVLLGTITTIGAFMGLLLTKSELLQDFGLFASLGLVGTTFFCLAFLPQFFNPSTNKKSEKAFEILEKINSYPYEKQRWLIVLITLVCVVSFIASDHVRFDSNLQNIGYNAPRVVKSKNLLASKTTGSASTVYFSAVSADLDSALAVGRQLTDKLDELKGEERIYGYSAPFTLFIPTEEQYRRIEQWNNYWTDEKKNEVRKNVKEAASEYKFNENTFIPFFNLLEAVYEPNSLYDADILPKGLLDNIIEYSGDQYLVFVPVQMDRSLLSEVGDVVVAENPDFLVVDPMYYTSDMVKIIHDDFSVTLAVSSIFVLIILLLSYRSVIIALIAFLPMGLSWYIVTGCMAIFGMEFNLINIVISTFVFGIGVDYSIFITDGLLATYRTRQPLLLHHKTAIFLSALILIIVVASLLFAVHPAISSIGTATLIGMGATLIIAYTLLPFLFAWVVTKRVEKGKAPLSLETIFMSRAKKNMPVRQIKDNYLYKGNIVEYDLRSELAATDNYTLLTVLLTGKNSMLDYGCGYGFAGYWAALHNGNMEITGIDKRPYPVTLADNCYMKTANMQFVTDASLLSSHYDLVIINRCESIVEEEVLKNIMVNAKTVMLRKDIFDKYSHLIDNLDFNLKEEDDVFVAYSRVS